jgi:integrase
MAHLYRKIRRVAAPTGAIPKARRGIRGVEWTDASGDTRWAKLASDGKRIEVLDDNWTVQYVDAGGTRRETSTRTPNRVAAEEIRASIILRVARERAGVHNETEAQIQRHGRGTVEHHLTGAAGVVGYLEHLADKGDTARHVRDTKAMILRVLDAAKIKTIDDLDSAKVGRAIAGMRADDEPLSGQTRNSYIRACKAFSTWLWRRKRLRDDPLRDLETVRTEPTRKLRRRALTPEELDKIRRQADASPLVQIGETKSGAARRLSLPDRSWAYRLAAATGLRAAEIGSLRVDAFDFDAHTVTVEAGYSKRRRRDVQPLPPAFSRELRAWVKGKPRTRPLFEGHHRWGATLKADAEAAGVPVKTPAGAIDFHALRHTYATRVAAAAPDAKTGQSLTRHSSAHLYLTVYAKEQAKSRAATVSALPSV